MGTQQLLLLALGVIVVGISIAVGILLFQNMAFKANEQAIVADLANYSAQVIQYWKTPMGEGGASQHEAEVTVDKVARFISFNGIGNTFTSSDGLFRVADVTGSGDSLRVILEAIGDSPKNFYYPFVITTVNLTQSSFTSVIGRKQSGNF
jgi:hypothetical protein